MILTGNPTLVYCLNASKRIAKLVRKEGLAKSELKQLQLKKLNICNPKPLNF
jgi:hypothetical protein